MRSFMRRARSTSSPEYRVAVSSGTASKVAPFGTIESYDTVSRPSQEAQRESRV
jgi:hypothetical protein